MKVLVTIDPDGIFIATMPHVANLIFKSLGSQEKKVAAIFDDAEWTRFKSDLKAYYAPAPNTRTKNGDFYAYTKMDGTASEIFIPYSDILVVE